MKFTLILIAIIFVFIIAIAFGSGNDQTVVFNYIFAKSQIRLSTLVSTVFGLGFIFAWLLCAFYVFRIKLKLVTAHKQIKKLEAKEAKTKELAQKNALEKI